MKCPLCGVITVGHEMMADHLVFGHDCQTFDLSHRVGYIRCCCGNAVRRNLIGEHWSVFGGLQAHIIESLLNKPPVATHDGWQ